MLKTNKLKIIALLTVIILALTFPIVRADDENTDMINSVENETSNESIDLTADPANANMANNTPTDGFEKNDVYLFGDTVSIDYIVDGNLFVCANNVTINSQIGGDAFICANTVTIGEQGYIFSNLFAFAKNVNINGVVYDLYSAAENTTINGYVYRDARVGSDTVNILGSIGRNAYVDCNTLNFTAEGTDETTASQPMINGNLNYSASAEANIMEGVVSGETFFEQSGISNTNVILTYFLKLLSFIVTVSIIWLLCLWLAPKFLNNLTVLLTTKKVLPVIGFGILVPILGIFLSIILLVLGITSGIGFLLLLALFALLAMGTSIFVITINALICNKLKIEKKIATFGMLVVIAIALWLLALIPFVGSVISIVAIVLGLGIVVSKIVLKDKQIAE